MRIRNLTPHPVTMLLPDSGAVCFPSVGIARAEQTIVPAGTIGGIYPVAQVSFGEPVGLPDPEEGTYLIVSSITASAARESGRSLDDLLLVTDTVRDEEGRIVGCRSFAYVR